MGKPTVEETIHEQDKAKRIEEESEILDMAKSLTNGEAGDQKLLGEVILWQVKESISHSTLLRLLITGQQQFQLKSSCVHAHKPKTWVVRVFGVSYSAPVSIAVMVVGFCVVMVCRKNGWM